MSPLVLAISRCSLAPSGHTAALLGSKGIGEAWRMRRLIESCDNLPVAATGQRRLKALLWGYCGTRL
jgi:hypothetical protein